MCSVDKAENQNINKLGIWFMYYLKNLCVDYFKPLKLTKGTNVMNKKATLMAIAAFCAVVIISFSFLFPAKAETTTPSAPPKTQMAFTTTTQFPIPALNGTINFAENGTYESAALINDTWVFANLQLNSPSTDMLSDSPTTGNLNITAQNSNITINCFDRLISPYSNDYHGNATWQTPGWLNYTLSGVGTQTFKIQFELVGGVGGTETWPIDVYPFAGSNASFTGLSSDEWPQPNGIRLLVNGAVSNVSISYEWAPVPVSFSPLPIDSSNKANVVYIVLLVLAVLLVTAIIAVAVLILKRRNKSVFSSCS